MQTRDYDDYVYISSIEGFRKVDDSGLRIKQMDIVICMQMILV